MAQRHIDASPQDADLTTAANAETLTNTVRVVWEDGDPPNDVIVTVQKIMDRLQELESTGLLNDS